MNTIWRSFFVFCFVLIALVASAQIPDGVKYQAVLRNAAGDVLTNDSASIRLAIMNNGIEVYAEQHQVVSNDFGLINVQLGNGTPEGISYSNLNWTNLVSNPQLDVQLDAYGTGFQALGTSDLAAVPFALVAQDVINNDDADADSTNEIQVLSISSDTIFLSGGGFAILPADQVDDLDADPTNELQVLSMSSDTVFLSGGGFVVLPADKVNDDDADATNELQVLSMSGDTVFLTDGGFIVLPADQVDDADADDQNELQNISRIADTVYLSDGGSIVLPLDEDIDDKNELQLLSIEGDTLSISSANSIVLPGGDNLGDHNLDIDLATQGNWIRHTRGNAGGIYIDSLGNVGISTNNVGESLNVNGTFKLTDGTEGNGFILTSDGNGKASWVDPQQDITAPVAIYFQGDILYVHPEDNCTNTAFGTSASSSPGATSITDGETNTNLMTTSSYPASKTCRDLTAHGRSDWYLPSKLELDAIYKQSYLISGLDHTASTRYWSSTEDSTFSTIAYAQRMDYGGPSPVVKTQADNMSCRCVRK